MQRSQSPSCVHLDWRPSKAALADAELISDWQVFDRTCGPYLMHGNIAGRPFLGKLRAMDAVSGWALAGDRLLVLGERSPGVSIAVLPREVAARATAPTDEIGAIRAETAALAMRARRAGMHTLAFLLDLAPLDETDARHDRRDGQA
jgi:hypothetical protein